ncbi:MAG: hypothetical protein O3B66_04335 [Actinomycetota bacterium]|nr:hypothetical protein [Actinomycetota bacterium]
MTREERAIREEERDFLLSSLDDLERERLAGDVTDDDYHALKESYTARAAAVLRELDDRVSSHTSTETSKPDAMTRPRRWKAIVIGAMVVAVAIVAGIVVANSAGERLPGQTMTGTIGDGSVTSLLVEARATGMADIPRAVDLYSQVLAVESDNVEALTYIGWLTVLSATQDQTSDIDIVRERFQSGLVLLRQATVVDDTYPDAHCFLGITFFRFMDDAEAAAPEVQKCLDSNPPAEVASLVEGLAADIAGSQP